MTGEAGRGLWAPHPGPGRVVFRPGWGSFVLHLRQVIITGTLVTLTVVVAVVGLTVGTMSLSVSEVLAAMAGDPAMAGPRYVVLNLRMPRTVTAVCAGAALGVAGSVFQSVTRNPLGSPDVVGFTTGAATGAITQIVVFAAPPLQVAAGAVAGGLLTAVAVYLLSLGTGAQGTYRLILTGIGAHAVLQAVNGLLLVKGNLDNAATAQLWLAGSLEARQWFHAVPVALSAAVLVPMVCILSGRASLMEMGDELACQLGVRVERNRLLLVALAVALAAVATGATGPIAFIALASAPLVKALSRDSRVPVVGAAAMGACLLATADLATRLLPLGATVPVGSMTGILGGTYLLWLLTRTRQI